jgi:hypothetical protein
MLVVIACVLAGDRQALDDYEDPADLLAAPPAEAPVMDRAAQVAAFLAGAG